MQIPQSTLLSPFFIYLTQSSNAYLQSNQIKQSTPVTQKPISNVQLLLQCLTPNLYSKMVISFDLQSDLKITDIITLDFPKQFMS